MTSHPTACPTENGAPYESEWSGSLFPHVVKSTWAATATASAESSGWRLRFKTLAKADRRAQLADL